MVKLIIPCRLQSAIFHKLSQLEAQEPASVFLRRDRHTMPMVEIVDESLRIIRRILRRIRNYVNFTTRKLRIVSPFHLENGLFRI